MKKKIVLIIFILMQSVNVKANITEDIYNQRPDFYNDYYGRSEPIFYTYNGFIYERKCGMGPLADVKFMGLEMNDLDVDDYPPMTLDLILDHELIELRDYYNHDDLINKDSHLKKLKMPFPTKYGGKRAIRSINGKLQYELAYNGHPSFPQLLTWEEYIYENGLFKAFTINTGENGLGAINAGEEWYSDNVYKLIKEGLLTGYREDDGIIYENYWITGNSGEIPNIPTIPVKYTFKGDNNITLAETVTLLSKINLPQKYLYNNNFSYLNENEWYYEFLVKGYEQGLFDGMNIEDIKPNKFVTREETAQLLYNSLKKQEVENKNNFNDKEFIKNEYLDAVDFLKEYQIINGYFDGTFKPQNNITRGEFATILLECSQDRKNLFAGLTPSRVIAEEYVKEYFSMPEEDRALFDLEYVYRGK